MSQNLKLEAKQYTVRTLVELKRQGKLLLPDLQRGFVWDNERLRMLFDSLHQRYPVGSLLLWKPRLAPDGEAPITTRAWDLCPPDFADLGRQESPEGATEGALYVLDGQQRLTSLFRVIFDSRLEGRRDKDPLLLVALSHDPRWKDAPFLYRNKQISKEQERDGLIIDAEVLFAGARSVAGNGVENRSLRTALARWLQPGTEEMDEAVDRANSIRQSILGAQISAYELETSVEDDEHVIEIFGRLNQQAVRLTPADLAAARLTGAMADFRRRAQQDLNHPDLRSFSHDERSNSPLSGGFVDSDLIVRTAMSLELGIIKYRDAEKQASSKRALYEGIAGQWDRAVLALQATVRHLRGAGVPGGRWLAYRYLLLPPAVAHARGHALDQRWTGWVLAASLWGLYAGSAETKGQIDAARAKEGDWEGLWKNLRRHARRTGSLVPDLEDLSGGVLQEDGLLLAMLLHWGRQSGDPQSLFGSRILGPQVQLQVHHIFPRAGFSPARDRAPEDSPQRPGNLTIIEAAENGFINDADPVDYLGKVRPEVLLQHGLPSEPPTRAGYREFCSVRERWMAQVVADLCRDFGVP